ncbi:aminoglycoside phosphotransferase family protein [Microbacterium murale]|uniref:Aminoglycoside phosphotransferase (APT) family kinase protein n=1 Tax=Microbacterium murale TaxID=1081040 RepID=A0ABU0PDB0_9MICO|nr:aminoglycoside phosphotransferase family protein [Microbacterium murale]MDQ0645318.1 aminoglycoside phosphotransferase (APT) family kinase protein [Microbacterium murale]
MALSPAAERRLDEAEVRMLLVQGAPHLARRTLQLVDEGWDNATWRLGDDLAVRIPRRGLAAPLIEHEQQALPIIGPMLDAVGVRTPIPVVDGRATSEFPWPWSIVPWIPGTHALERPRARNAAWAPELANALRALHRTAPADAPHNPVRGIPLAQRDERLRELLALVPNALRLSIDSAWSAGLAAPVSTERVWIHGDLHPGNIVIAGDRLSALIDFGDVTAGDPSYDLAIAWMAFDAKGRAAFRHATAGRYDDATWVRARAWAASVAAILLVQSDDRDGYRALGRSTAAELLARDVTAPRAP